MHAYIHAHIHTYGCTCIHTCVYTYIHVHHRSNIYRHITSSDISKIDRGSTDRISDSYRISIEHPSNIYRLSNHRILYVVRRESRSEHLSNTYRPVPPPWLPPRVQRCHPTVAVHTTAASATAVAIASLCLGGNRGAKSITSHCRQSK